MMLHIQLSNLKVNKYCYPQPKIIIPHKQTSLYIESDLSTVNTFCMAGINCRVFGAEYLTFHV
jgi:hypothetical protein